MAHSSNSPLVSVVILNYNTVELLEKLLPFVEKTVYGNFEIVVADNDSSDGSLEWVRKNYPKVKCIQLHTNLGFAGGYNEALRQLKSEYWVLLNSDVEVTENWLQPMVDLMLSSPDIAAVQPKMLDYQNRTLYEYAGASGGYVDQWGYPLCRGRIFDSLEVDNGQYNDQRQVFWATGAAMLVRAEQYNLVGGMDDDFFAHMEEIDLCWRLQNAGFQVWVCPTAEVYHMGGGTLSALSVRKTFLNFRNNLALLTKNLPVKSLISKLVMRLILDGIAGVKYVLDFKFNHCWAIVRAHWAFYLKFGKWWSKRDEQPNRKKPRDLIGWMPLSAVWQFFVKGIKTFSELEKRA